MNLAKTLKSNAGVSNLIIVMAIGLICQLMVMGIFHQENANFGSKINDAILKNKQVIKSTVKLAFFSRPNCTLNFRNKTFTADESGEHFFSEVQQLNLADFDNVTTPGDQIIAVGDKVNADTITKIALNKGTQISVGSIATRGMLEVSASNPHARTYSISIPAYIIFTDSSLTTIDSCMLTEVDNLGRTFEDKLCEARGDGNTFDPGVYNCIDNALTMNN